MAAILPDAQAAATSPELGVRTIADGANVLMNGRPLGGTSCRGDAATECAARASFLHGFAMSCLFEVVKEGEP